MTNDNKLSEHEKLKEIADKIGYNIIYPYNNIVNIYYDIIDERHTRRLDVREIIFTPEFMDLIFGEYEGDEYMCKEEMALAILEHLDNPVDYLYNIIK